VFGSSIMIIYKDEKYNFYELFNEENGTLIRGDVDGIDPVMRSFPELLDVGIMGHCNNGIYCQKAGIDCYQRGAEVITPHMSVEDFELIARQACGKVFQIALGGAGDPNKHPSFEEILKICRYYHIVPNITTSGFQLLDEEIALIKKYCGAVAVSWYSRIINDQESNLDTIDSVNRLVQNGCTTNIHFVVSKDTLTEAIQRLEEDRFPCGINAVIFILYKPVGMGVKDKVISSNDKRLAHFFESISRRHPFQIGFDTCFTPAIVHRAYDVSPASIDACEASTFSMYIDSRMNCYPCSFGIWSDEKPETLYEKSLREIWNGKQFSFYRYFKKERCTLCTKETLCHTGCRLGLSIDLCSEDK